MKPMVLTTAVLTAAAAISLLYLSNDLWAVLGGIEEAAEVVGPRTLPVDGPSVTLVRVKDLEADSANAKVASRQVVTLDDWTFTQAVQQVEPACPWRCFFDCTGGGFQSPFGFNIVNQPAPSVQPLNVVTEIGNEVFVVPPPMQPLVNGSTVAPFLNGASIFLIITQSTLITPVNLGTAFLSHRHGFASIQVITTINILNVSISN